MGSKNNSFQASFPDSAAFKQAMRAACQNLSGFDLSVAGFEAQFESVMLSARSKVIYNPGQMEIQISTEITSGEADYERISLVDEKVVLAVKKACALSVPVSKPARPSPSRGPQPIPVQRYSAPSGKRHVDRNYLDSFDSKMHLVNVYFIIRTFYIIAAIGAVVGGIVMLALGISNKMGGLIAGGICTMIFGPGVVYLSWYLLKPAFLLLNDIIRIRESVVIRK